ncbi:helix-turn-helix domain-containing protein [Microbacterium sp. NPDC089695]|uniref:helix-turn-helix domain-containing protein n=1 Tax=Microbacterium sp. NPDC089695 TaxID=3364198 RepID=UPI003804A0A7
MTTQGDVRADGDEFNAAVGRQLRGEIAAAGSSIAGMARDIGIARSALDNYVTGKRAIPVPIVYAVSAVLGIAPHHVITRAEERLRAEGEHLAPVTPLTLRADVPTRRHDGSEVAFDSPVPHDDDTDDLYP